MKSQSGGSLLSVTAGIAVGALLTLVVLHFMHRPPAGVGPIDLVIRPAIPAQPVDPEDLKKAFENAHLNLPENKNRHKLRWDGAKYPDNNGHGTLPHCDPSPGARTNNHVTQRVNFANSADLEKFLTDLKFP